MKAMTSCDPKTSSMFQSPLAPGIRSSEKFVYGGSKLKTMLTNLILVCKVIYEKVVIS